MVITTTGTITKALRSEGLDVDRDAVCYAVRELCIEPVGVAGPARVFPPETVAAVRDFIETKRRGGQRCST